MHRGRQYSCCMHGESTDVRVSAAQPLALLFGGPSISSSCVLVILSNHVWSLCGCILIGGNSLCHRSRQMFLLPPPVASPDGLYITHCSAPAVAPLCLSIFSRGTSERLAVNLWPLTPWLTDAGAQKCDTVPIDFPFIPPKWATIKRHIE